MARLPHFEPTEPFRSKFQYNNMMFMLAGYLVEKLTAARGRTPSGHGSSGRWG